MTQNQIRYQELQESIRTHVENEKIARMQAENKAREVDYDYEIGQGQLEVSRMNAESARIQADAAAAKVQIELDKLAEDLRHNLVTEGISKQNADTAAKQAENDAKEIALDQIKTFLEADPSEKLELAGMDEGYRILYADWAAVHYTGLAAKDDQRAFFKYENELYQRYKYEVEHKQPIWYSASGKPQRYSPDVEGEAELLWPWSDWYGGKHQMTQVDDQLITVEQAHEPQYWDPSQQKYVYRSEPISDEELKELAHQAALKHFGTQGDKTILDVGYVTDYVGWLWNLILGI